MNVNAFLEVGGRQHAARELGQLLCDPVKLLSLQLGAQGRGGGFRRISLFSLHTLGLRQLPGYRLFGTQWQYADIVDWPGKVNRHIPKIPLVRNVLRNHDYRQYYLDYMEHMLDTEFNPTAIAAQIGPRAEDGLWHRVRQAAYLESDTPDGRPFTGRRYNNDEVYQSGCRQRELRHGKKTMEGIVHYVPHAS